MPPKHAHYTGRGITSNHTSRFLELRREQDYADPDRFSGEEGGGIPRTHLFLDHPKSAITRNNSPDVPFDRSINPYQGCEHGCPYCYARPTHAYLGLSPGLDFETRLFVRQGLDHILERELQRPGYRPAPIALGANTDPYQPIERRLRLTRSILDILNAFNHPVLIVTKSALVERDLDILAAMAARGLAHVTLSITTLNEQLARRLEPRASSPQKRLAALRSLRDKDVPSGVMFAPVIPSINEHEMERILAASHDAGARTAGYVMLRLPREVKDLFGEWLEQHFPERAGKVKHLIRTLRQGRENSSAFGERMRGRGQYAGIIAQRFKLAHQRNGFKRNPPPLDCSGFAIPDCYKSIEPQGDLFYD